MSDVIGAVLVVGGGISGIQTSLDLAESGYKVYLLDKGPSIGGVMSQLDKTFPTNDCSMCILAPKLVGVGRHQNIELITLAELRELEGGPRHFKAIVHKTSRYINEEKCTGCSDCAQACPVTRKNVYDENLKDRKAVYTPFPQAVPLIYTIEKRGLPPCRAECPANVNVQGYINLINVGKYREALEVHRRANPLALVCGRVCPHPCEAVCNRKDMDTPLNIMELKRFMAERAVETGDYFDVSVGEASGKKVAIIGSGPAGMSAAFYLRRLGHSVTIFEKLPRLGGMLTVGIPRYRLPSDVIASEFRVLEELGVEMRTNMEFGKDITYSSLKADGFGAVLLGHGAHVSLKLGIPGEELSGVLSGVDMLRGMELGEKLDIGDRVAVIGGGNVAFDSVKSAVRSGKDAFILYRRTRAEMPANVWEIEEAEEEGIELRFLVSPLEILGDGGGHVKGIRCARMELGEPDASGRRRPVPIKGSEFIMDCDTVVPAISQRPETKLLDGLDLETTRWDTLVVDPETGQTGTGDIFAMGDAVLGPATVVAAVGDGRKVAYAVDRYLNGLPMEGADPERVDGRDVVSIDDIDDIEDIERMGREEGLRVAPDVRRTNFGEFAMGLTEEQARREASRCLECGVCCECMECVKACKADAVDHSLEDEELELDVGSVILSPGFETFDATLKKEYGYGVFPNVVTSMEFERIMSASGPFEGHIKRLSDGADPEKIAFIQCVGSRDASCNREYCSSVCCMYSIKEAIIAKEHAARLHPSIFYMDMRAYGKEFDYYYDRAKDEYGIRFVRSRVAEVEEIPDSHDLILSYVEGDEVRKERFNMVVLAVGFEPPRDAMTLARKIGVELDGYGFCKTDVFRPLDTSREGVFVSGAFSAPKDIPDTVAQASGAASRAGAIVSAARGTLVTKHEFPEEEDVKLQRPRVGVFVCHCGINIGGVVDVPSVVEYARTLPNVEFADDNLFTCSQDTQEIIKEKIREHHLNRVVVASCSPRTHEPLFRSTIREAGLNQYLFEMTNIRDQCSWVHMNEPEKATVKSKDLVRMAVAKSRKLEPLKQASITINKDTAVIGGGISGMTSARALSRQGFRVFLLEKEKVLGGHANHIRVASDMEPVAPRLASLVAEVEEDPLIEVMLGADIREMSGFVGNFHTRVRLPEGERELEHGAVVIAVGATSNTVNEYGEGTLTQQELGESIGTLEGNRFVMIQCAGSREMPHNYCSRFCCTQAVINSIRIMEDDPGARVYILYRDMRTYGEKELLYKRAQALGVRFVRYEADAHPVVEGGVVTVKDPVTGGMLRLEVDHVVLSVGAVPNSDNERFSRWLKVPLSRDGFFLEAHMKLKPVEFATEGVFLAGLAHSPKFIEESISQAEGAASRAITLLSKDTLELEGIVSIIDEAQCNGCGMCVDACPFNAIDLKENGKAEVNSALCKGCGVCVSTCRVGAAQQLNFKDEQILEMVTACFEEDVSS